MSWRVMITCTIIICLLFPTVSLRANASNNIQDNGFSDSVLNSYKYYEDFTLQNIDYPETGLPVYQVRDKVYSHPVKVAIFGLTAFEKYITNKRQEDYDRIIRSANYFVDEIVVLPSGVGVWYYSFDFLDGETLIKAPWVSGMAQGQGISVLVRAYLLTNEKKYLETAEKALKAFYVKDQGTQNLFYDNNQDFWIEEYPQENTTHVLNGYIYALFGIWDYYRVTQDKMALSLWQKGINSLKSNLPNYDVGNWSAYDQRSTKNDKHYFYFLASKQNTELYVKDIKIENSIGQSISYNMLNMNGDLTALKPGTEERKNFFIHSDNKIPGQTLPIQSIRIVNNQNTELARINMNEENDRSSIAAPPKWSYSWGPTYQLESKIVRNYLVDHKGVGYFYLTIDEKNIGHLQDSEELFLEVEFFDATPNDQIQLIYDNKKTTNLGKFNLEGSKTWKKQLFRIPHKDDPIVKSETYQGWGEVKEFSNEYTRLAKLDNIAGNTWEGAWLSLFLSKNFQVKEDETLKVSVTYIDSNNNPIWFSIFNAMGYPLGKLSNNASMKEKTDTFSVSSNYFIKRFAGDYHDVHLIQLAALYNITHDPFFKSYFEKWKKYGSYHSASIQFYLTIEKELLEQLKIKDFYLKNSEGVIISSDLQSDQLAFVNNEVIPIQVSFPVEKLRKLLSDPTITINFKYQTRTNATIKVDFNTVNKKKIRNIGDVTTQVVNQWIEASIPISEELRSNLSTIEKSLLYYRLENLIKAE
ncbi:D-glucuronyl C5-epimerase family protein [Brevibacillus sp. SYSU BS000544]